MPNTSVEKARDEIIAMQIWAAQRPKENAKLLVLLLQVRNQLESMM